MAKTKGKQTVTYNRRAWWPDYWTVEMGPSGWCVLNGKTRKLIYGPFRTEIEAVAWADTNKNKPSK